MSCRRLHGGRRHRERHKRAGSGARQQLVTLFVANSAGGVPVRSPSMRRPTRGRRLRPPRGERARCGAFFFREPVRSQRAADQQVTEFGAPYTGSPLATVDLSPVGSNFGQSAQYLGRLRQRLLHRFRPELCDWCAPTARPYAAATFVPANTPEQTVEQAVTNNLFVTSKARCSSNTLRPTPEARPRRSTPEPTSAERLALDPAGDFFVAYYGSSKIAEYQPPYTGGPAVTISVGLDGPATAGAGSRQETCCLEPPAAVESRPCRRR